MVPAGVARLEAARELALCQLRAELQGKTILSGSGEAKQYLQARYGGDPHESFVCVYLNNKHHVVNIEAPFPGYDRLFTGIPSGSGEKMLIFQRG